MPNGKTHIIAGVISGVAVSCAVQNKLNSGKDLDLSHLLLSAGTGAATGRLPDILEPATHPNHRAFFHSFAFAAVIGYAATKLLKEIETKKIEREKTRVEQMSGSEILLHLAFIAVIVILVHLLLDGFTKKGLPLI